MAGGPPQADWPRASQSEQPVRHAPDNQALGVRDLDNLGFRFL